MKKFKISMLGLMFLLAVAMMTGCRSLEGSSDNETGVNDAGRKVKRTGTIE